MFQPSPDELARQGIDVVVLAESELHAFIGEARQEFAERFGSALESQLVADARQHASGVVNGDQAGVSSERAAEMPARVAGRPERNMEFTKSERRHLREVADSSTGPTFVVARGVATGLYAADCVPAALRTQLQPLVALYARPPTDE